MNKIEFTVYSCETGVKYETHNHITLCTNAFCLFSLAPSYNIYESNSMKRRKKEIISRAYHISVVLGIQKDRERGRAIGISNAIYTMITPFLCALYFHFILSYLNNYS